MNNYNTNIKAEHAKMEIQKEFYQSTEEKITTLVGMGYGRERYWKGLLRRNET